MVSVGTMTTGSRVSSSTTPEPVANVTCSHFCLAIFVVCGPCASVREIAWLFQTPPNPFGRVRFFPHHPTRSPPHRQPQRARPSPRCHRRCHRHRFFHFHPSPVSRCYPSSLRFSLVDTHSKASNLTRRVFCSIGKHALEHVQYKHQPALVLPRLYL